MDSKTKLDLITRQTEEILTPDGLSSMVDAGVKLRHYIGFEISGKVHLGTGIMTGAKIADFQKAGVDCSCFLATWHAWINNKFGGDIETIRKASAYFEEALRSSIEAMGGDEEKVRFVNADKFYHNNDDYWMQVVEIAKHMTVNRAMRAITIMGRNEGESVPMAYLMYPAMQVADIYAQGLNIAHSGIDQRKAHAIAREVGDKLKVCPLKDGDAGKPIAIHHHLLIGLSQPPEWPVPKERLMELWSTMKMSKSVPGSAIFVNDTEEEIRKKMMDAFCPAKVWELNPVLDYAKHITFRDAGSSLAIDRPAKFGGSVTYDSYTALEKDFADGKLHPLDLKKAMAEYLVRRLEPIRKRFEKPKNQKLLEMVQSFQVTR